MRPNFACISIFAIAACFATAAWAVGENPTEITPKVRLAAEQMRLKLDCESIQRAQRALAEARTRTPQQEDAAPNQPRLPRSGVAESKATQDRAYQIAQSERHLGELSNQFGCKKP